MKEILFPAAAPSVTAERKPGKMELKASREDDDSIGGSARHSSFSHSIACAGPGQQPGGRCLEYGDLPRQIFVGL